MEDRCLLSGISGIIEFSAPGRQGPDDVTAGPDGNIWFTELNANLIGEINPTTHAITEFTPPKGSPEIQGITSGPDGNVWFAEWGANEIGMINPTTDAITQYALPKNFVGPHMITAGPDGNIWFTDGYSGAGGYIGMINLTTHAISEFAVPYADSSPFGITTGADNNLWFADQGNNTIGVINPTTHAISEFSVPTSNSSPFNIIAGSNGNLWFTERTANQIGEINPTTDAVTEFAVPTANAATFGITAGPDGNVWFTEPSPPQIGRINTTTDAITEYPIAQSRSGPDGITAGPDGNLWFADYLAASVGVATLASTQLVVTQQPPASVTAGSPFGLTVEAEDSSGNLITSFDGPVTVALASNPGGATLGGTLTVTASNGVATFSGLTLTTAASGYTLYTSGGGLGWGVTNAITVPPAAASQLVITAQPPASVEKNSAFGLQASIEDVYGNVVTSDTNAVSVALDDNPTGATLGGTLSVSASQGVATFSGLTIDKVGSGYTLEVSSSGLTGAVSSAISVVSKSKVILGISLPTAAGPSAIDLYSAPLVFDSPDFLDSLGFKKRTRSI